MTTLSTNVNYRDFIRTDGPFLETAGDTIDRHLARTFSNDINFACHMAAWNEEINNELYGN